MTRFEDKRKNFRFPAFDDDDGVKLRAPKGRILFEGQRESDIIISRDTIVVEEKSSEDRFYSPDKDSVRPRTEESNHREEAARIRAESRKEPQPDFSYQGPPISDTLKHVTKPVFHSEHKTSLQKKIKKEKQLDERVNPFKPKNRSLQGQPSFVPRHVPASLIADQSTSKYSKTEVMDRLKKKRGNLLVMDDAEDLAFKHDPIEKRMITPFETQEKDAKIPFTRREFKKLKKESGSKSLSDMSIPAISKKRKESSVPKNARLEKSLGGIMEEETAQKGFDKYFD